MKVVKFGGSSLATSGSILLAKNIVESDPARKFIIVSAPGRAEGFNRKVTDLLIETYAQLCYQETSKSLEEVITRFENLGLELGVDIEAELERCVDEIYINKCNRDFVVSRGEYMMALLFSKLVGYRFVDATRLIIIKKNGKADEQATKERFSKLGRDHLAEGIVIGGFYGCCQGGGVKLFPRGGSDYSGAIAAALLPSKRYENFTDTYGVQTANPAVVSNTQTIPRLDYKTLHKLSLAGASVIYPECLPLLKKYNVPMIIDNTFDPFKKFTTVSNSMETGTLVGSSFFCITYETKQNINKHMAQVLCIYNEIHFNPSKLEKALEAFEVYLTTYKKKCTGGEFSLLASASQVEPVVQKLHKMLAEVNQ